jgi:flagellar biogenesis protein FliO
MTRIIAKLRWLSAAVVITHASVGALAADIGGFIPPAAQQPTTPPAPFHAAESQMRPLASHSPSPAANRYLTPGNFPERTAVAAETGTLAPFGAAPASVDARNPLPLSAPNGDAERHPLQAAQLKPLATGAASLGIVLGLFVLVVLVTRRGMPGSAAALPRDAVEVLGRLPFVARQQVHLVRCGNKLLLVCVSGTSTHTLTEIADPEEVDHLMAICQGSKSVRSVIGRWFSRFGRGDRSGGYYADSDDVADDFAHGASLSRGGREVHA